MLFLCFSLLNVELISFSFLDLAVRIVYYLAKCGHGEKFHVFIIFGIFKS